MKLKLSQKVIDAVPMHSKNSKSAVTEYSFLDAPPGLRLAVSSNRKSYWMRYSFRGKKRVLKLAESTMSISEVVQIANDCRNMLCRDLDPADERNRRKGVPTLNEFALNEYLPYAKQHKRSWQDDESRLRREIGEMIGHIPITEVGSRDVMQLHAAIFKKNSAATANRYLALVSRLFSLAIQWGYVERNPARGVKKYKESGPRFRYIAGDELMRFLNALEMESGKLSAIALKLLLLTGLRSRSELFSLKWTEVDLQNASIRLLHTKNGKQRICVLNSLALELMKKLHDEREEGCPWVFPARVGDGHLVDIRKPLKRAMKRAGISEDLRPHDLRRSYASLLCNAGVDIYQIKDLLGHSNVTVTQRAYAHLQQNTLRTASEVVAKTLEEVMGRNLPEVIVSSSMAYS
jgi:integrase